MSDVTPSRVARLSPILGIGGAALAVLGVLGLQAGVFSGFVGFRLFGAGAVLGGLLSLLVGLVGVFLTRGGADPEGRKRAWIGTALGAGLLALVFGSAGSSLSYPPINDITTNLDDPPQFTVAGEETANQGRDMSYPAEFVPIVRAAYPDLATLRVAAAPDAAFDQAVSAAEELGWTVTWRDPGKTAFEAQQETRVFRFVDDIRVRVRPGAGGSELDVRSKSRDGKGDLGANAIRIRAFSERMAGGGG